MLFRSADYKVDGNPTVVANFMRLSPGMKLAVRRKANKLSGETVRLALETEFDEIETRIIDRSLADLLDIQLTQLVRIFDMEDRFLAAPAIAVSVDRQELVRRAVDRTTSTMENVHEAVTGRHRRR